jgi:DNA repair protein RecO (recombination protein O)
VIVKTRAIVLREIRYRDQSKICTLFTREYGLQSVIIKGGRNPKSKLAGRFIAGTILDIVLYRKTTREIQLVSDGNLLFSPMVPQPDIERFGIMYRIIDMVSQSIDGQEKNIPLFSLISSVLEELYGTSNRFQLLYAWFLLNLVSLLGFEPSIHRCALSNEEITPAMLRENSTELSFLLNPGGVALPASKAFEKNENRPLPTAAYVLLSALSSTPLTLLKNIEADPHETDLLCKLLEEYCTLHLVHLPHKKNVAIVSQILSE